jgi:hypothetical protein
MKCRSFVAAFALVVGLAWAQPSNAALVLFDDFNGETQGLKYNSFDHWNVTAGTVDVIPVGALFNYYPGQGNYVDLNGSSNTIGELSSQTVFGPGTYTLTFLLGGSAGGGNGTDHAVKTTLITLGDFSASIPLAYNAGLTTQSFTFTTTTAGNLVFASLAGPGSNNVGNILDNVSLATAAPEPATWAMMLIGFAGVAFVAYRRSRRSVAVAAA